MDINAQRRMLDLAGMSHVVLTEAKKTTIKEDAAQSLVQQFGGLGQFVVDTLESYKGMTVDPSMAGEIDPQDAQAGTMDGFVEDMLDDQLGEIFASAEYKQLCTEIVGQGTQVAAQPEQGVLDV